MDVTEGEPVSIPCAATGSPTALVTISHDVQPSPNVVATGLQAAVYRIEKVGPGYAGKYVCYAKSGEAKITRNIWLKVFCKCYLYSIFTQTCFCFVKLVLFTAQLAIEIVYFFNLVTVWLNLTQSGSL